MAETRTLAACVNNKMIIEQIRIVHARSKQTYGSPRITRELQACHICVSRPRVARLMKLAGIRSSIRKKYVVTTDSKHNYPIAENKLNRNFNPETIGKAWVSDITYIKTGQGWLYLTVMLDLADRKVIGWSLSKSLKAIDTTIPAWKMAVNNRPVTQEMIFHSDRGVQYACTEFRELLGVNKNVIQSMSRKGNCWDNAVAESFFKNLKAEWTNREKYQTTQQAAISVFEYIETWYNTRRRHSSLNYLAPVEYENYLLTLKNAA
jgi:transposase InsO family protein